LYLLRSGQSTLLHSQLRTPRAGYEFPCTFTLLHVGHGIGVSSLWFFWKMRRSLSTTPSADDRTKQSLYVKPSFARSKRAAQTLSSGIQLAVWSRTACHWKYGLLSATSRCFSAKRMVSATTCHSNRQPRSSIGSTRTA